MYPLRYLQYWLFFGVILLFIFALFLQSLSDAIADFSKAQAKLLLVNVKVSVYINSKRLVHGAENVKLHVLMSCLKWCEIA